MAKQHESQNLPLFERIRFRHTSHRVIDTLILFLLLLLLAYRLAFFNSYGIPWFIAFFCELWFTFTWFLIMSTKWTPAITKSYPDRLLERVHELPAVDLFVTTADPVLEPPIITVNTVLSLLAVDYPVDKLACYISDDGCSPVTFYSLVEACEYAKLWVPFCKKHNVLVRAPFKHFNDETRADSSEFQQEWQKMKDKYEQLSRKVEEAAQNPSVYELDSKFTVFSDIERRNHPSIIKVIWENKNNSSVELPHIVYISREKRPKFPHHYKAGAMNSLTRVSGLMTNAPFMLNVDCDMFVDNPKVILHAMCIMLDEHHGKATAFVQFPQMFYDALKDDPFGNQFLVLYKYIGPGLEGLQGPFYGGTNCVHRRKVIYGLASLGTETTSDFSSIKGAEGELSEKFGRSREFVRSAAFALDGKDCSPNQGLSDNLHAANHVITCAYEIGTYWGKRVGWLYGSATEDVLTGLGIHIRGWKSRFLFPDPPAFLGTAPQGSPAAMTQQKRWAAGLLEILFSNNCPILYTLYGKLELRMCLAYLWIITWGMRSAPEVCYALLPAYCIIANSQFLPKVHEPGIWIPATLFVVYNLHVLAQYLSLGQSIQHWWNNQRMARITSMTGWFLGFIEVLLKLLGVTEIAFEVTRKDPRPEKSSEEASKFSFDYSPLFIPGTTMLLVQLTALAFSLLRLLQPTQAQEYGIGEVFCSTYLVVCLWPFLRGLFGKGKHGVPSSTLCKSAALTLVFMAVCLRAST